MRSMRIKDKKEEEKMKPLLTAVVFSVAVCLTCESCQSHSDIVSLVSGSFSKIFGPVEHKSQFKKIANNITQHAFGKYMLIYGKNHTGAELKRRFGIFENRVEEIIKSKIDYLEGRSSNANGINQFADMTEDEILPSSDKIPFQVYRDYSNLSREVDDKRWIKLISSNYDWPLSTSKDWRESGCVLKPRYQGACGSCYAFAVMSVLETMRCLSGDERKRYLSSQLLVDCHNSGLGAYGCQGGTYIYSLLFLQDINLVAYEDDYPYKAHQDTCKLHKLASEGKLTSLTAIDDRLEIYELYVNDKETNINIMKQYINNRGPLLAQILIPESFHFHKAGVWIDRDKFAKKIGHALVIVGYGYDSYVRKDYWLVKNSYGTDWGEDGYGKIEMGTNVGSIEEIAYGISHTNYD